MSSAPMQATRHLYVHVPFCRHKCGYCDFNVYTGQDRLMPDFVDAVAKELRWAAAHLAFSSLRTVYIGGGTPSVLPAPLAARLLAAVRETFRLAPGCEVTLEANPASTDPEKLAAWREGGVNRLSLGVQGFDPHALAILERKEDGARAEHAMHQARAAGFDNISLDLIYAVPGQSDGSWVATVERALALDPEHLSCYGLQFEEGTLLYRRLREGRLRQVPADRQWELQQLADQVLRRHGFRRYEVSSWARPGRRSRHNSAYWACRPYYGAGPGAHSYGRSRGLARRWWNVRRPRDYIARSPLVEEDHEDLDSALVQAERVLLGLRTVRGLRRTGGFGPQLERLAAAGLVRLSPGWVAPTERGLDLHNQIAMEML
ncbi:MAG: radical SAM family heme chaperone HemW [Candidatus Dormibacteraeota bacterium]|nr:radical SAM family heme chaperone HemW [Candidatus Dormibacteraeota bacterium]